MASTNLSKDRSAIYFGQHWAEPYRTVRRQSRIKIGGQTLQENAQDEIKS